MKLTIRHWNGDTLEVDNVESTHYIDDLKERIEELHDIPVDQQRFSLNGNEIDDTETVEENGIEDGMTLVLEASKVTIVYPSDKGKPGKIRSTFLPTDTVKRIKRAAIKKMGDKNTKVDSLVVLFGNVELKDSQRLCDVNIDHGDVVVVEYFAITVAHFSGDLIPLSAAGNAKHCISPHDTTDKIRTVLHETMQIPLEEQKKFKFQGVVLNDFLSLKSQNVGHKAVLQIEKPVVKKEKKKFQLSIFPAETPGPKASREDKITITVHHWNGSTFDLHVSPAFYMEEFKEHIQDLKKIPVDQQRLTIITDGENNAKQVDDTETLEGQGIADGAIMKLEPMKIIVVLPNKKKMRFVVVPEDTLKRIKRLVSKKAGLPADRQIILFNGDSALKDTATLLDLNIDDGDELIIETYEISVQHWNGEEAFVLKDIGPSDTPDDIKQMLRKRSEDLQSQKLKLLHEGRVINDFLSLKDQKISHRTVLTLEEPIKEKPKKEKFVLSMLPSLDDSIHAPKVAAESQSGEETITIKPTKGDTFTVAFVPTETVEELKTRIEKSQNIPVKEQVLVFGGTVLEDVETLGENDITASSTINLEPMKIHVMLPQGKKIRFAATLDDTVKRIKKIVGKKSTVPVDSLVLMLDGVELTDLQKLGDCNVGHDEVLTVETYSINVMHWSGDMFLLTDVKPDDNPEDVRNIISKRKNIPKEMQKFKFEGRFINDFMSLKDQKIKHKSILVMEDLEIIKSPRPARPTISEIKYVDTSDEESMFGSSDDDEDGKSTASESSYIKRAAMDENFTAGLLTDELTDSEADEEEVPLNDD
jgi:uncharacterized ubiquitin-like protein YukD